MVSSQQLNTFSLNLIFSCFFFLSSLLNSLTASGTDGKFKLHVFYLFVSFEPQFWLLFIFDLKELTIAAYR